MRGSPKPADTKVAVIETWGNSVNFAIPFRSILLAALMLQDNAIFGDIEWEPVERMVGRFHLDDLHLPLPFESSKVDDVVDILFADRLSAGAVSR